MKNLVLSITIVGLNTILSTPAYGELPFVSNFGSPLVLSEGTQAGVGQAAPAAPTPDDLAPEELEGVAPGEDDLTEHTA